MGLVEQLLPLRSGSGYPCGSWFATLLCSSRPVVATFPNSPCTSHHPRFNHWRLPSPAYGTAATGTNFLAATAFAFAAARATSTLFALSLALALSTAAHGA